MLNEGKAQYLAGKFDEALESLKLAEFGLLDEKEFVSELYFYYALSQYKKGQVAESQALLDKMKLIVGEAEYARAIRPKEIERDLSIMIRALAYLGQPGSKPGSLPFFNLFYDTWDLLKEKKIAEAEAKLKVMGKMNGDANRMRFLEGFLAFQKGDYKRCLGRLEKVSGPLAAEYGEDASFYLAYSYLKRGNLKEGEKWAQKIKNPDHIHQLMDLMDELKAANQGKEKK
jgi:tetratricopeptide (TPR) repeat protein